MNPLGPVFSRKARIEKAASAWMVRLDRGLSPGEQDAFTSWLAADPRHREAMAFYQWSWEEFDRLAGLPSRSAARVDPDFLIRRKDPGRRQGSAVVWIAASALLAAASLALVLIGAWKRPLSGPVRQPETPAVELMARIEKRTLEDGSQVELNRGCSLRTRFSREERRVFLLAGEASFSVAKEPERPFVVVVAGLEVRAVGTIFNVRHGDEGVEVIVSEGRVAVGTPGGEPTGGLGPENLSFLERGQRGLAQWKKDSLAWEVSTLDETGIAEALSWQPRLLDFDAAPLIEIVTAFNRHNPIQVQLGEEELKSVVLSSSFWSDNVEGFVRLMESSFGMKAEWRGPREIVLRRAR